MESLQAITMLSALAQESRLAVFRRLAAEGAEIAGGDRARRDGRSMRYALDQRNVTRLMSYLWEDCCGGRPELCGIPARFDADKCCGDSDGLASDSRFGHSSSAG